MTHVDLFSGIGGFALAAGWAGFRTVCFCEIDPYCQAVLQKHWPGVPIIGDVRDVTRGSINGRPTLVTGGVPCQPASVAGKRRGKDDDRWLWPEAFRVVRELRPHWCLFENVNGLLTLEDGVVFDHLLSDLEGIGYSDRPFVVPACAVNAPHRRDRVWIVANAEVPEWGAMRQDHPRRRTTETGGPSIREGCQDVADSGINGLEGAEPVCQVRQPPQALGCPDPEWWAVEPNVGRVVDGLSHPLDGYWDREPDIPRVAKGVKGRVNRLKCLGNAIVPAVAYQIIKAIADIEKEAA